MITNMGIAEWIARNMVKDLRAKEGVRAVM
jgi:hypothetical protein